MTITDVSRGVSRALTTNQVGEYVAPSLLPSDYSIRVTAKGFTSVEHAGIELEAAQSLSVNFTIRPGATAQTVVVRGGAPLLNTTSPTLGGTVSSTLIGNLPLNGRNFVNLVILRPGIVVQPGSPAGNQVQTSENGLPFNYMGYLLDGLTEYEPFQGESLANEVNFGGDAATILPIDAIQQFNVVQQPGARYGWFPGAVVSVALKSGTNQFHGTAYAFGRSGAWDARNFFNTVPNPQTPVQLEQFGGSLGGPIKKDKLFFFATYEGQRYTVGNTFTANVPVTVPLTGNGVDCAVLTTGNCKESIPNALADLAANNQSENSVSAKLIGIFPDNTGTSTSMPLSLSNSVPSDNGVGKLDYQLNAHQQLGYTYFFGNQAGTLMTAPVVRSQFISLISERIQTNGFHWTWVPNASWVNAFRLGYDRFQQGLPANLPGDWAKSAASYGIPTGVTAPLGGGLPDIYISGLSTLGGDAALPKFVGPNQLYELDDDVSYLHGKHYFTFGVQEEHWIVTAARLAHLRGRLRFNHCADGSSPLECFLVGEPYKGSVLQGNPVRRVEQWSSSVYFQDSWHMKPTLTVNMGLRYNYLTAMKEAHGGLANFFPGTGIVQEGLNGVSTVYNPDPNDWSPRLGFSWNPHSGNTVIRGGASLMYSRVSLYALLADVNINNSLTTGLAAIPTQGIIPGGTINTATNVYKANQLSYNSTGPVFPSTTDVCPTNQVAACSILGMDRNFKNPSVVNWSLDIQHSFGQSLALEAAYVGDHGRNLAQTLDINQINPSSAAEIACNHCEANADRPYGTQFPYLQFINMFTNVGVSNYNALQITFTDRGTHGLSFLAAYTWSHALDTVSSERTSTPQNSYQPGADYANGDNNAPQRFTFSTSYALPQPHGELRPLLGGWNLTSIVTLMSGMPWGPVDLNNDVSRTGEFNDRWDFFGHRSDFSHITSSPIPYFSGTSNSTCVAHANTPGLLAALSSYGCYADGPGGRSVLIPPAAGTFGTMGRNMFSGPAFYGWDFSVIKNIHVVERLNAQFRVEIFNVLNHPQLANPQANASGFNDPSSPGFFGCGCATPDVVQGDPVLGSGGARDIQLGLKMVF